MKIIFLLLAGFAAACTASSIAGHKRDLRSTKSPPSKYRSCVAALAGYEAAETGRVLAVDEALPDA